jgi:hypothetical protein
MFDTQVPGVEKWGAAIARAIQANLDAPGQASAALHAPEMPLFLDDLTRFDGDFVAASRGAFDHAWLRVILQRNPGPELDRLTEAIETGQPLTVPMQQMLLRGVTETFTAAIDNTGPCTVGSTFGDVMRIGRGGIDLPGFGIASFGLATVSQPSWEGSPKTCRQRMIGGPRAPFLVQLGPRVRSWSALLWGASEDPQSPHFSDQSRLISAKRLRPNWFEPDELLSHIASCEILATRADHDRSLASP